MELSEKQAATLRRAKSLRDNHGADGIFVSGAGHASHLRAMERRGWMRFVGYGCDIDGICEGDVAIYELTPAGETALQAHTTRAVERAGREVG